MSSINNIVKRLRENRILTERKDYEEYSRDELIALAQEGDQLAVETLVNTHKNFLRNATKKYFLRTGDNDDLMQIATIAFWDAIQSWDGTGDFEAYAGMIIKRYISKEIEKESTGKSQIHNDADSLEREVKSSPNDAPGGTATVGDMIPDRGDSAEDVAAAKELLGVIEKYLMDNFTAKEREVIEKYVEGYKQKEIAEVMGMGTKQVENILYKIKSRMKEYLKDRSFMESRRVRRDLEFSDEEKKILESALHNIKHREIRESNLQSLLTKDIEDYYDFLEDVEVEVSELLDDAKSIKPGYRDSVEKKLGKIKSRLYDIQDDMSDEEYEFCDKIMMMIPSDIDDLEYTGSVERRDPYAETGHSVYDFV